METLIADKIQSLITVIVYLYFITLTIILLIYIMTKKNKPKDKPISGTFTPINKFDILISHIEKLRSTESDICSKSGNLMLDSIIDIIKNKYR